MHVNSKIFINRNTHYIRTYNVQCTRTFLKQLNSFSFYSYLENFIIGNSTIQRRTHIHKTPEINKYRIKNILFCILINKPFFFFSSFIRFSIKFLFDNQKMGDKKWWKKTYRNKFNDLSHKNEIDMEKKEMSSLYFSNF